jgi:hypothetical protein
MLNRLKDAIRSQMPENFKPDPQSEAEAKAWADWKMRPYSPYYKHVASVSQNVSARMPMGLYDGDSTASEPTKPSTASSAPSTVSQERRTAEELTTTTQKTPIAVGTEVPGVEDASVKQKLIQLIDMGFSDVLARRALNECDNDVDAAVAWLIEHDGEGIIEREQSGIESEPSAAQEPTVGPGSARPAPSVTIIDLDTPVVRVYFVWTLITTS